MLISHVQRSCYPVARTSVFQQCAYRLQPTNVRNVLDSAACRPVYPMRTELLLRNAALYAVGTEWLSVQPLPCFWQCFCFFPELLQIRTASGLKKLFSETRPTLVFSPPPTLKNLWTLYWDRNFSGLISIADWLLPHHASCPDHLSTK